MIYWIEKVREEEDNIIFIDLVMKKKNKILIILGNINELTKKCENKVQERKRENQRQKFDSSSYEKERQEKKK